MISDSTWMTQQWQQGNSRIYHYAIYSSFIFYIKLHDLL